MMLLDQKMHFFKHYPIRYLQNSLRIEHKSERTIDRRSILQTWMTRWPDLMRIYFHCKLGWRHILLKWYLQSYEVHYLYQICQILKPNSYPSTNPSVWLVFDKSLLRCLFGFFIRSSQDQDVPMPTLPSSILFSKYCNFLLKKIKPAMAKIPNLRLQNNWP